MWRQMKCVTSHTPCVTMDRMQFLPYSRMIKYYVILGLDYKVFQPFFRYLMTLYSTCGVLVGYSRVVMLDAK